MSLAADFRGLCRVPFCSRISENLHGQCELSCAKPALGDDARYNFYFLGET